MSSNYFLDRDKNNIEKLSRYLESLPKFCYNYFLDLEPYTSTLSRLNYAMDLRVFFDFLAKYKFMCKPTDITEELLNKVTSQDITSYLSYLSYYTFNGKNCKNGEKGKARKLSSIRSLFKYLFNKEKISSNVASKVATPKIHSKDILRLEVDEVGRLINQAENPSLLTKQQQGFNKHTQERDVAMLTLFLGTGIRVSECVGLNVEDIDFDNNAFKITRKGGNQVILYFGVRAVENLVKKYSRAVTPLKKISPHKLRSTYGTNLYRETGDIYIVADVLGHKDVNTTRKHYAAISEDKRRSVADIVKLRN